jgi:hypothetical protein
MKRVKPITRTKDGQLIIHLSPDAANADWFKARRLLLSGQMEELKQLENEPMYFEGKEDLK